MKIAIVGTRGIPNNYGGFETLAEYLAEYLSKDIDITVFCSSKDIAVKLPYFKGAKLKYIPITSHGSLGILYDSVSLLLAVFKYEKILFLGFGGGFIMPFLRRYRSKIILNIGGLDWKRDKWSPFAQKVIKRAELLLVKHSAYIVSDNIAIQQYLMKEYGKESTLIAYGGDQAQKRDVTEESLNNYSFLKNDYAFIVTRIQPDNNIDMILEAFANQTALPLVMVGNWNNSTYGMKIKAKYLHNKEELINLVNNYHSINLKEMGNNLKQIAERDYVWSTIASKYKEVILKNSNQKKISDTHSSLKMKHFQKSVVPSNYP